jgi:hypothetical protein
MISSTKFQKMLFFSRAKNGYSKPNLEVMIIFGIILANLLFTYSILEYDPNSIVYYSDGISHLVITREIFDSLSPGLGQLGTQWLPITHLLLLPFVTNDLLFHSGLAGTIISTISTAMTAVILFRIARLQFDSELAGILASSLCLLNLSVIYMGVVPMMELPFMMFFMLSVYYIQQWYYVYTIDDADIWKQYRSIIKAVFAISAATLTAYEGWALPFALVLILLAIVLASHRRSSTRSSTYKIKAIIAAAVPYSFAGIIIWLVWNLLEQKDPLYFANGLFSSKMQSSMVPFSHYLYFNPADSLSTIFDLSKAMYGMPVLIISAVGLLLYFYMYRRRKMIPFSLLLLTMLLIPTLIDFVGMVLGYQEILPSKNGGWSNGRELIFMAPFFALTSVSVVVFVAKRTRRKVLTLLSVCFVVALWLLPLQLQVFTIGKVIALNDADSMIPFLRSDQLALHTGRDLKSLYTQDGNILLLAGTQHSQEIMFQSGIPLKNFIDSGSGKYWSASSTQPWMYAEYIVLDRSSTQEDRQDPTYHMWGQWQSKVDKLLSIWQPIENYNALRWSYHIIYQNEQYDILKRVALTSLQ